MTTATKQRKAAGGKKSAAGVKTIRCAFCGGTGRDPYEILSKLSNCQVCGGRGTVEVHIPTVRCAYCHGTGKQRRTRLTCSACKGTGVITLAGPAAKCPECGGTGKMPGADMPCTVCKGAGLIGQEPKAPRPKQEARAAPKAGGRSKSQ